MSDSNGGGSSDSSGSGDGTPPGIPGLPGILKRAGNLVTGGTSGAADNGAASPPDGSGAPEPGPADSSGAPSTPLSSHFPPPDGAPDPAVGPTPSPPDGEVSDPAGGAYVGGGVPDAAGEPPLGPEPSSPPAGGGVPEPVPGAATRVYPGGVPDDGAVGPIVSPPTDGGAPDDGSGVPRPPTGSITVDSESGPYPPVEADAAMDDFSNVPSYEEQEFVRRKQRIDEKAGYIEDVIQQIIDQGLDVPIGVLEKVRNVVGSVQTCNDGLAENYREYGQEMIDLPTYISFLDETMIKVAEHYSELSVLGTFLEGIKNSENSALCTPLTHGILEYTRIVDEEYLEYSIRLFRWAAEVDSKFSLDRDQSDARQKIVTEHPDLETDPFIFRKGLERTANEIYKEVKRDTSLHSRDRKATNSNVMKWLRQAAGELIYFFTEKDFKDFERDARNLDPTIIALASGHAVSEDSRLKMEHYGRGLMSMGSELTGINNGIEGLQGEISEGIKSGVEGLQGEISRQSQRASEAEQARDNNEAWYNKACGERDRAKAQRFKYTFYGSCAALLAGVVSTGLLFKTIILPKETKKLEDQVTAITAERDDVRTEVTGLTSERDSLTADLTAAKTEVTGLTSEKDTLTAGLTAAKAEAAGLTAEKDTLTAGLAAAKGEVTGLTNKRNELAAKVTEYEAIGKPDELRTAGAKIAELTKERDQAKTEAADLTTEVDGLNKKLADYSFFGSVEDIKKMAGGEAVDFANRMAEVKRESAARVAEVKKRLVEYEALGKVDQIKELLKGDTARRLAEYIALGTAADLKTAKDGTAALRRERDQAKTEAEELKRKKDELTAKVAEHETNLTAERENVAALTTEKTALTGERDAAKTKVEDLTKKRDDLAAKVAEYTALGTAADLKAAKDGSAALTSRIDAARSEVDDLTRRLAEYVALGTAADVKAAKNRVTALTGERDTARAEVDALKKRRDELTAKVDEYTALGTAADLKAAKDGSAAVIAQRDQARGEVDDLTKKRDELTAKVAEHETNLTAEREKVANLTTAKDNLTAEKEAAKTATADLNVRLAEYTALGTVDDLKDVMGGKAVTDKLAEARKKVKEYEALGTVADLQAAKDSVAALTGERDAARTESADLKKEIADLKDKIAAGKAVAVAGGAKPPVVAAKSPEIKVNRIDPDVLKRIRARRNKR
jgi:uncharacterized coiled-coil DUF342 family protein